MNSEIDRKIAVILVADVLAIPSIWKEMRMPLKAMQNVKNTQSMSVEIQRILFNTGDSAT